MKLKKYNNYLNEDKYDDDDDFFGEYGSQDETQDDAQGEDDMEHLLYLLRTFLKDSGIKNVSLKNSTDSIKLEIVLKTKERLSDVIKTFAVLKKLSNDIMADYDSEFDIWETKMGDPLLIIDYYSPDYDDDEDGAPF
jgi:hypothetical protein